ncbi:hypothetical protein ACWGKW_34005 [Streptomyces sp. NPDC054766]
MTRTAPSALERALIAEVGKCDITVSAPQLERWRGQLWLAPATQWTDPATGLIRTEIVHRAAWLSVLARAGRSISWVGWSFWAIDATPDTTRRLREAVIQTLQLPFQRADLDITQIPEGDGDDAFALRQVIAAQMLSGRRGIGRDLDGTLRAHAADAGVELPAPGTVSNVFGRSLVEVGSRLMVGSTRDVSLEELAEVWERNWVGPLEQIERIRGVHAAASHAGVDLSAQSPLADGLPGLIRAVREAEDEVLCAAVEACAKGSSALAAVMTQRSPDDPEVLGMLVRDVIVRAVAARASVTNSVRMWSAIAQPARRFEQRSNTVAR